jgi:peptidoglycan/xylan/chitin deacetylase (PgdA/CDA1 family)
MVSVALVFVALGLVAFVSLSDAGPSGSLARAAPAPGDAPAQPEVAPQELVPPTAAVTPTAPAAARGNLVATLLAFLTPTAVPPLGTPAAPLTPTLLAAGEVNVPILMYHYISVPPAEADVYRRDLSVSPERFREQMAWLQENGYHTVTLYQIHTALTAGVPLPDKPIVLTFDDGYVDNYENAFPILREFGFTGTFFILTDVTDRSQPGYMTWDMIREMSRAGMSIEVHGREHVEYTNRDRDWLVFHLLGPAQTIQANLGYQPRFIAYTAGRYDDTVISVASEMGYWGGITTIHGRLQSKDALFEMKRIRIRGAWTLPTFAAVVRGS